MDRGDEHTGRTGAGVYRAAGRNVHPLKHDPESGNRFSDKIMLQQCGTSGRVCSYIRHGAARFRGELPVPHDDHHRGGGRHEDVGAEKPAEISEREEEGALAAVELTAGGLEQPGRAQRVREGFGLILEVHRGVAPIRIAT